MVDGLSPDIMHDVLEGTHTLELPLKQFLLYLTEEKMLFTIDTFNERIQANTKKSVPIKPALLTSRYDLFYIQFYIQLFTSIC